MSSSKKTCRSDILQLRPDRAYYWVSTFAVPISRSWLRISAKSAGGGHAKYMFSVVCGCLNLQKNGKINYSVTICRANIANYFFSSNPRAKAWRQGLSNPETSCKSCPWWLGGVLGRSSDKAMLLVPPYTSSPKRGIPKYFACARIYVK